MPIAVNNLSCPHLPLAWRARRGIAGLPRKQMALRAVTDLIE